MGSRAPNGGRATGGARALADRGLGERMARRQRWRRWLRWLNLTLVHQGIWPLTVVLFGAPAAPLAATAWGWWAVRAAAPPIAALLALVYLIQTPPGAAWTAAGVQPDPGGVAGGIRRQARLLLVGGAVAVAVARLVVGPVEPVAKVLVFGAADVAAFQLIHFGVVARTAATPEEERWSVLGLFALSWAIREATVAAVARAPAALPLAFGGGLAVGLAVGALSWGIRRWPGGAAAAWAAHWLVVYLIAPFLG